MLRVASPTLLTLPFTVFAAPPCRQAAMAAAVLAVVH
jgi:hypothetical protein